MSSASTKRIAAWLLACCGLIFAMVLMGGLTRLTRSGLSIVEWAPIMGAIPPLSHEGWLEVFRKYQQTPEYRLVNLGMSLEDFKSIFLMEYAHRLLGRLIGLAFAVPLVYFVATRQLATRLLPRLTGIFVMGASQGALGWFMVKSGLVDVPQVSQYRLTAHLGLAFLTYAACLWTALGLLSPGIRPEHLPAVRRMRPLVVGTMALIFTMILSGGFVAGLKAGYAYNTFPLMGGQWIPAGIFALEPLPRNFFENVATVQFGHRFLALLLAMVIPTVWWKAQRMQLPTRVRYGAHALLGMLALQITLGITTLLFFVPVALAAAHQAGALVLFSIALFLSHELSMGRAAQGALEAPFAADPTHAAV